MTISLGSRVTLMIIIGNKEVMNLLQPLIITQHPVNVEYDILSHMQRFSFSISSRVKFIEGELFTTAHFQTHHKEYLINGLGPEAVIHCSTSVSYKKERSLSTTENL